MQKSTAPAGHGLDPQTPAATHRSTASTLGNLPHSILAREVMRLKEARDVVLRGGGGGILEQAEALRNEIAQIELQAQADTIALAQEVTSRSKLPCKPRPLPLKVSACQFALHAHEGWASLRGRRGAEDVYRAHDLYHSHDVYYAHDVCHVCHSVALLIGSGV